MVSKEWSSLANRLSLSSICAFTLSQPQPTHTVQRRWQRERERESRIDSTWERERDQNVWERKWWEKKREREREDAGERRGGRMGSDCAMLTQRFSAVSAEVSRAQPQINNWDAFLFFVFWKREREKWVSQGGKKKQELLTRNHPLTSLGRSFTLYYIHLYYRL